MQFKDNQKIQNFIHDYLNLCKKYDLCISTTAIDDTSILRLYILSDYDYYDFVYDNNGKPIPIYFNWFIKAIEDNYDEKYFEEMMKK